MKENFPQKITERSPELSKEKIEENLKRAKDSGRLLEQAYWESVKEGSIEHIIEPKKEAPEPPIRSHGVFDHEVFAPEKELTEIKTVPKEDRKQKLQEFKEKLAYQKEGLARTQEKLTDTIRGNPDISWPELYGEALDLLIKYGADEQKEKVREILSRYYWRHKAIKEAREQFSDENQLFKAIFGQSPRGKIEVIEGPVTLYFRCYNIRDYALISQQSFLKNRAPSWSEKRAARMEGGVSIQTSLIPHLRGTVIAERAKGEFGDREKSIYVHEEQHAIKKLFDERPVRRIRPYEKETDVPLVDWLRKSRERLAELRIKDEILAYMKEGRWNSNEVFNILIMSGKNGGLYDYLSPEKTEVISIHSKGRNPDEKKVLIETVKKVFETEYHDLVRNGIRSFQDLTDHGYSIEQTVALLNAEPLSKWPKIVKRLTKKQT